MSKQKVSRLESLATSLADRLGHDKVIRKTNTLYIVHTNMFYADANEEVSVYLAEEKEGIFFADFGQNIVKLNITSDLSKTNKDLLNKLLKHYDVSFDNTNFYTEVAGKTSICQSLTDLLSVLLILPALTKINI